MCDVNLLESNNCAFTPEQFLPGVENTTTCTVGGVYVVPSPGKKYLVEDIFVAPMHSFPWAIVQVFRNTPARLNSWPADTYIKPVYNPQNNNIIDDIVKVSGNNPPQSWAVQVPEMTSCDWGIYNFPTA
ncbi:MAG: hypothetical protein LBI71_00095 [Enterobacteriaceae bacterium]|jgi:hypothetical protein|nr:hypothetical protein [Enterobacteriaceae bacterium]